MKTHKAKHLKTRKEIKNETKEKLGRFSLKKAVLIALICIFAALLLCVGRIVYYAFVNPQAAFQKTVDADTEMSLEEIPPSSLQPSSEPEPQSQPPEPSANESMELKPPPSPSAEQNATPSQTNDAEAEMLSKADLEFIKNKVNILLVGVDENPEREKTRVGFRSDVMLLLCIDFNQKTAHLLSIPRDSYAPIYKTKGRWKINSAFMHGGGFGGDGFNYCMKTVSNLLGGIPINYYAGVQMDGLKKLIDALGGVNYNVDIRVKMNGRILQKGMQHLTGQQVLDYCRIRKGIGTDINRVDRQQKLLLALFDELKSQNKLALIPKVFDALKDDVYTNMSLEQLCALAVFAADLNLDNIKRHTLKGEYMPVHGTNFYVLDQSAKVAVVKEIFNIKIKADKKYDLHYLKSQNSANTVTTVK